MTEFYTWMNFLLCEDYTSMKKTRKDNNPTSILLDLGQSAIW